MRRIVSQSFGQLMTRSGSSGPARQDKSHASSCFDGGSSPYIASVIHFRTSITQGV